MDKNAIKKELLRDKQKAYLTKYCKGNLYYKVELLDGTFEFPIAVIEPTKIDLEEEQPGFVLSIQLAKDLGDTPFLLEMEARHLNRWIERAIDNKEFIKSSKPKEE